MADDDRVGAHRLEGERGVLEALALGHAGALGGEVDDVGGEPLGGGLERDPGAGGVLEEEVDHGAAAQRGSFLIGRSASERISSAVSRTSSASSRVRSAALSRWRFIVLPPSVVQDGDGVDAVDLREPHPDPLGERGRAGSCRRSRRGSAARGGRGRPAPRAGRRAGGRGRRARRARRGWCGRRRARRRRGRRPCRRCRRRDLGAAAARGPGCSRRSSRYIVTSSEPTGTSTPSTAAILRGDAAAASGTPRVGMPSRTRSSAPLLRSRISWAMRVRAREMSRASRTVRRVGRVVGGLAAGWAQARAAGPPSPPHGTAR